MKRLIATTITAATLLLLSTASYAGGAAIDGVPAAIAGVVTPTKNGYEFYLSCKPKPLPQEHIDRDPTTQIFIGWIQHVDTNVFDFYVLHKRYSGHISNRAEQYTNFEYEIKKSNSTNWDFWYWIWKGQNVKARNSYMVGGIELGMRGGETAWRYKEYAGKFGNPNEELVAETDWDCTRVEGPPRDEYSGTN